LDFHLGSRVIHLDPSQISALNPLFVMILIPVFSFGLYPLLGRLGFSPTPLRRFTIGMFTTGGSFVVVAFIQAMISRGVHVNAMWQIVPYLILTSAEILVSITGLEFAYTQAPPTMKSTIMSFWFLTIFFGNLLTAYVEKANPFGKVGGFIFFAVLMFLVAIVFAVQAARYRTVDYVAKEKRA